MLAVAFVAILTTTHVLAAQVAALAVSLSVTHRTVRDRRYLFLCPFHAV